ncbi:MAG TPA: hypothetical protein VFX50_17710, partial [Gemmatimonadales bacterium]|nr:hypothetical protein [Gemmatimonadales bacterium]
MRLLLAAAALVLARPAAAQSLREFTAARQQRGEPRLAARIEYASGSLTVLPAAPGTLYDFRVTYDEERFRPL